MVEVWLYVSVSGLLPGSFAHQGVLSLLWTSFPLLCCGFAGWGSVLCSYIHNACISVIYISKMVFWNLYILKNSTITSGLGGSSWREPWGGISSKAAGWAGTRFGDISGLGSSQFYCSKGYFIVIKIFFHLCLSRFHPEVGNTCDMWNVVLLGLPHILLTALQFSQETLLIFKCITFVW